jgi:hypothetical protein
MDRSVAWWSTLLLVALAAVLTALLLSLRLVLSVGNEQGSHSSADAALPRAEHVSPPRDILSTPNRSESLDRD